MKINFEIKSKMSRDECFFFGGLYFAVAICMSAAFVMFLELLSVFYPRLVEKVAVDLVWIWALGYAIYSVLAVAYLLVGKRTVQTA